MGVVRAVRAAQCHLWNEYLPELAQFAGMGQNLEENNIFINLRNIFFLTKWKLIEYWWYVPLWNSVFIFQGRVILNTLSFWMDFSNQLASDWPFIHTQLINISVCINIVGNIGDAEREWKTSFSDWKDDLSNWKDAFNKYKAQTNIWYANTSSGPYSRYWRENLDYNRDVIEIIYTFWHVQCKSKEQISRFWNLWAKYMISLTFLSLFRPMQIE